MKRTTTTLIAVGVAAAVGGATLAAAGNAAFDRGGIGGKFGHGMLFFDKGQYTSLATEMIGTVDTDGDGMISQAEIDQVLAARVAAHDANGDGSLGLEEFASLLHESTHPFTVVTFQNLDTDGDGAITGEELDNIFANIVARLDRNGDGGLSMSDRWHGRGHGRGHDHN